MIWGNSLRATKKQPGNIMHDSPVIWMEALTFIHVCVSVCLCVQAVQGALCAYAEGEGLPSNAPQESHAGEKQTRCRC